MTMIPASVVGQELRELHGWLVGTVAAVARGDMPGTRAIVAIDQFFDQSRQRLQVLAMEDRASARDDAAR